MSDPRPENGPPGGVTRVAVLGGGVGAMVAAFELTRPELHGRFEVTVYQPGWRLGGKGASGRNTSDGMGKRIEEHGLHVWFGFYENAFAVMRDVYTELSAQGHSFGPFKTVWDAFKGCETVVAFDRQGDQWVHLALTTGPNPGEPGDGHPPQGFWEIAEGLADRQLAQWPKTFWSLLGRNLWRPKLWRSLIGAFFGGREADRKQFGGVADQLSVTHRAHHYASGQHLLRMAKAQARQRGRTAVAPDGGTAEQPLYAELLIAFRDFVWDHFGSLIAEDPKLRFFFTTLDAWACGVKGVVDDGVLEHGFDVINERDLCDWLEHHGAKKITVGETAVDRSPMLRAIYDLAFAYEDGELTKPNAAAGTAAGTLLRLLFSHSGYILYKMQAGMGDAVFGPFYRVLAQRGVSFRFFHTVTRLGLSEDKTEVGEIDVARQFEVAGGHDQYRPLMATVDGGDPWCWPDEPDWSQLRGTKGAPQAGPNLLTELEQGGNPMRAPIETLHLGQDFDQVVLGISVGALKPLCGELMEHNEAFGRAIEAASTTPTQGFQLWLREDTGTLGWPHGVNSVAGAYVEPLDTFCDMSHLTDAEAWPAAAGVKGIGYFCGVMPRVEGETQAQATDRVKQAARDFVKDSIAPIWPGAVDPSTGALRNDLLVGSSPDRMNDQYYRANIAGTELYVLTPAGSVKDRIRSDTSGFANLVLAGDWTRNGIDGGCVEAAATSGRQAARALTGAQTPIYGEDPTWLTHGSEPPFIEYGTLETSPGPFKCTGGKFLVLVVPANQARLQALLQRVLNAAAPDSTRYRPLGSHVVLMVGHIDSITSLAPGFEDRGFASEWQATLTVPAVAGVEAGGIFWPKRIVTFLPYLLVDNSISLTGGREIYGLAKALGQFPPSPPPADWRRHELAVKGFGGNFAAGEQAGWQDLLRVVPVDGGAPDAEPEWTSVEDVARHLVQWAGHEIGSDLARLGFRLPWEAVARTFAEAVPQVCLRQFRADDAPGLASSRKVVEVHLQVDSLVGRRSPHGWKVDLSALDSHPIGPDLGVGAGAASLAFELEMDFVLR